jgi:hypothetical protein
MRQLRGLLTIEQGGIVTQIQVEHCCHCGSLLGASEDLLRQRVRGEGQFGFCSRCNSLHCAAPSCRSGCRPQEQGCENVEAGRGWHDDGSAVRLFLPVSFPGR